MALFDAYIFVDWSSANKIGPLSPTKDSVWMGEFIPSLDLIQETYHRSRYENIKWVKTVLKMHVDAKRRILIGFDFPYGYPFGFSEALNYQNISVTWIKIWEELHKRIKDTKENINNRFFVASEINYFIHKDKSGPFWGCPKNQITENLKSTSPGFPFGTANGTKLDRLRIVESRLPGIQETWKLFGAGSVGSQAMVGIPYLYQLINQPGLRRYSKVWPFETKFFKNVSPEKGPFILHAEIWPGVVKRETQEFLDSDPHLITDQAQVRAMCQWAAELDMRNELGRFFDKPDKLNEEEMRMCLEHEGWILGAK